MRQALGLLPLLTLGLLGCPPTMPLRQGPVEVLGVIGYDAERPGFVVCDHPPQSQQWTCGAVSLDNLTSALRILNPRWPTVPSDRPAPCDPARSTCL